MERTLDIMMAELEPVEKEYKILEEKVKSLRNEIEDYKLSNNLYHPMSELANYKGKEISWIKLVERNKDGTLDTDFMCCDEFLEVDEDGYLHYSSFEGGITHYDDETGKYVHYYYGCPDYHDYVGFLEIKFYNED